MAALEAAGLTTTGALALNTLIDRKQVQKIVGLSRSPLYARIAAKTFPAGVLLSRRARRWRVGEVLRWLQEQTNELPAQGAAK